MVHARRYGAVWFIPMQFSSIKRLDTFIYLAKGETDRFFFADTLQSFEFLYTDDKLAIPGYTSGFSLYTNRENSATLWVLDTQDNSHNTDFIFKKLRSDTESDCLAGEKFDGSLWYIYHAAGKPIQKRKL